MSGARMMRLGRAEMADTRWPKLLTCYRNTVRDYDRNVYRFPSAVFCPLLIAIHRLYAVRVGVCSIGKQGKAAVPESHFRPHGGMFTVLII